MVAVFVVCVALVVWVVLVVCVLWFVAVVVAVDAVDVRPDRFGNLRSLLEELTPGRGVGAGVGRRRAPAAAVGGSV